MHSLYKILVTRLQDVLQLKLTKATKYIAGMVQIVSGPQPKGFTTEITGYGHPQTRVRLEPYKASWIVDGSSQGDY